MPERFLRLPEVTKRVGLSRSRIYALMVAGQFPQRTVIGVRAIGWPESVIERWIASRIAGGEA